MLRLRRYASTPPSKAQEKAINRTLGDKETRPQSKQPPFNKGKAMALKRSG